MGYLAQVTACQHATYLVAECIRRAGRGPPVLGPRAASARFSWSSLRPYFRLHDFSIWWDRGGALLRCSA